MNCRFIETEEDLSVCAQLFMKVFREQPWCENWKGERALLHLKELYDIPRFTGFMVEYDGTSIGFLMGYTRTDIIPKHFNLSLMCVDTHYQRQGIALRQFGFNDFPWIGCDF